MQLDLKKRYLNDRGCPIDITINNSCYLIETFGSSCEDYAEVISRFTDWRNQSKGGFFSEFTATPEGTDKWFRQQIEGSNQNLFLVIRSKDRSPVGHFCLRQDEKSNSIEIENILRGEATEKSLMTLSIRECLDWVFSSTSTETIFLRGFADNAKAIQLYKRLGFIEKERWPVYPHKEDDRIIWNKTVSTPKSLARDVVLMETKRA